VTGVRFLLVLMAAALFPATLVAQSAPLPAAAQPRELATNFDPPLDKPLRYRVTQEKVKAGKTETSAMDQEVTYRRESDGIVMTVRPVVISSGGQTIDLKAPGALIPPMLKPLVEAVELDLDEDGSIVQVRNWEAFKVRLEASIPAILATAEPDPNKRAQSEPALRKFLATFFSVGADNAPRVMLKGWPDLLGFMGVSGTEGEDQMFETQVTTPFSTEPLPTQVTFRLVQLEPSDALRIEVSSAPNPEAFGRLIRTLMDSMAPTSSADKPIDRVEMERELATMDLSMTMEIELDSRTGLLRRGVVSRSVAMNEGSGTNRIIVEAQ
jgi:hypothetical protein